MATPVLFAFGPEDLQRFAIPIGIGLAVLLVLVVPSFRRSVIDSFKEGKEAGERMRGKQKFEEEKGDGTSKQ